MIARIALRQNTSCFTGNMQVYKIDRSDIIKKPATESGSGKKGECSLLHTLGIELFQRFGPDFNSQTGFVRGRNISINGNVFLTEKFLPQAEGTAAGDVFSCKGVRSNGEQMNAGSGTRGIFQAATPPVTL